MICHKSNHYAVMKIIPKENIVQVWDAVVYSKQAIEKFWKVHAIHALKIHVPEKVQEYKLNILTNMERITIECQNDGQHTPFVKGDYPTIIVHGMLPKGYYRQTDQNICGPIVINHYASELKNILLTKGCQRK